MPEDTHPREDEPLTDDELGPPVVELRSLRDPVPPAVLARIGNTIRRRELAADVTRFWLWTPFLVLMEYVGAAFESLDSRGSTLKEGGTDDA